jgi:uncharacterized protein YutE (UPF0331/DUF86 family)
MLNDIILNKKQIIERCIGRINEEYANNPAHLRDITKQDSIVLNLQRACEASIALAMHIVTEKGLGIPQVSREAFDLLVADGVLEETMAGRLKAMVGFRNIAVHDYQRLNLGILQDIIEKHVYDLIAFARQVLKIYSN